MTALRWFLSYLLPMLILASITAAYYYRDQLSANWYHTLSWPVTQINAVLDQQKLQLSVVKPAISSEVASIPDTGKNTESNKNTIQPLIHPIIKETPIMPILPKEPETAEPKVVPKHSKPTEKLALAPQTQQYLIPYPQSGIMPPAMRPPLPRYNVPNYNLTRRPAPIPPTVFKLNKKQRKLLYQARKAYWMKDLKNAKKHYLTLTTQLPDNPDIQGELGNLFYFERKLEPAIKHYTLAAKLLVKHRHFWKLPGTMHIISRFNPEKANEVMQLMRNKHSTTTKNNNTGNKGK